VQGRILTRERQLVQRRGGEVLWELEALLCEVGDDFVSLLGETKERGTRDVFMCVRETRTQPFLEFRLSIHDGIAFPVVAHGGECFSSR